MDRLKTSESLKQLLSHGIRSLTHSVTGIVEKIRKNTENKFPAKNFGHFFGHFGTKKSKKYLDISPNESLFIKNGESCIEIFDPELSEVRRSISTTTTPQVAKFFPSGQVILIADHNVLRIADVGSGTVVRNRRSS